MLADIFQCLALGSFMICAGVLFSDWAFIIADAEDNKGD